MKICFNDQAVNVAEGVTLGHFLEISGVKSERVVIEFNDQILPREQWGGTVLHEGDRVFAVTFVGGG